MEEWIARVAGDLAGRLEGPLTFRVILQPTMAALYALRDGIRDARAGRPPYLRTILTSAGERRHLLQEGWTAVLRVIALGIVMDLIYQVLVFRHVYVVELVIVVFLLAFLPYVLLRGPVQRIARHWPTL